MYPSVSKKSPPNLAVQPPCEPERRADASCWPEEPREAWAQAAEEVGSRRKRATAPASALAP